ncbi:prepilin peptidase [Myxococcota bacterium]
MSLLAAAVWLDIRDRRIPNVISLALLMGGVSAQVAGYGWMDALRALAIAVILGALLIIPWLKGGIGGGDLKLTMATATWLGVSKVGVFILVGAVAGGLAAIVCYVLSKPLARRAIRSNLLRIFRVGALPMVEAKVDERISVPYSIAIAFGGIYALLVPGALW